MSKSSERDQKQRAFGFIGVSMMAHVGLLAMLSLVPQSNHRELIAFGDPSGAVGADTLLMDLQSPGSTDQMATQGDNGATTSMPKAVSETLVASASDTTAVAVPKAALETKPQTNTAPIAQAKKAAAPTPKTATVTKKSPSTKVVTTPPAPATTDDNDDAVRTAVAASRAKAIADDAATPDRSEPIKPIEKNKEVTAAVVADTDESAASDTSSGDHDKPLKQEMASNSEEEDQTDSDKKNPIVAPVIVNHEAQETTKTVETKIVESKSVETRQADIKPAETKPIAASQEAPAAQRIPVGPIAQAQNGSKHSATASADGATGLPANTTQNGLADRTPGNPSAAPAAEHRAGALNPGGQAGGSGVGSQAGSGLGHGVPLGVRIRDARELIAQTGNRQPLYPEQERLNRREGTNVVVGRVLSNGTIGDVYLEKSSGSPLMDREALAAFKQWKYMPGQEGFIRQPFKFQLDGRVQEIKGTLRR
jgi:TonB family protein